MYRTVRFACVVITAVAVIFIITELKAQDRNDPSDNLSTGLVRSGPKLQGLVGHALPPTSQGKQIAKAEIPNGFCLAAMNLDASTPIIAALSPGQQLDVFYTNRMGRDPAPVKRLLSGVTIHSVDHSRGAPVTTIIVILKRSFAESFILAQKTGELDVTIVSQKSDPIELQKQNLELNLSEYLSTGSQQQLASRQQQDHQSIEDIATFRKQMGSKVRDTLNEIQQMTQDGPLQDQDKIFDQAFRQHLEHLIRQKGNPVPDEKPGAKSSGDNKQRQ